MAYAYKINKVTMSGTCFSGTEIWSTGFYTGFENTDSPAPDQASVDAIAGFWTTFFTAVNSHISNSYNTTEIKIHQVLTTGGTDLSTVFHNFPTTPPVGGGGTGAVPPQCSIVASLRSATPRGLGSKGRMYLPGVSSAVSTTTGKITSSNTNDIRTTFQTFLNAVNASSAVPGQAIIASKGRTGVSPVAPLNKLITQIQIGDVYDTQRRRRNALQEVYSLGTITTV